MGKLQKWFVAALVGFLAFTGAKQLAYAEGLNGSVKDCIQHPKQCEDQNSNVKKSAGPKNGSNQVGVTIWDFVRMIFATAFVVVLLYVLLRFINKKSRSFQTTKLVENLGGTALGTNRSVQIVKIANRLFVVGVGDNVQLLKEIDDPGERTEILAEYNKKLEQLIHPNDLFTKIVQKTKRRKSPEKEETTFSSLFKAQLDELSNERKMLFEQMKQKGSNTK